MPLPSNFQRPRKLTRIDSLCRQNIRLARRMWAVGPEQVATLKSLTREFKLSLSSGDLKLLDRNWYVTHAGLLRLARRYHCAGIKVQLVPELSKPLEARWIFRAAVYTPGNYEGFVGYGDADPSNVSPLVRGAEMRVAETRAVNRALRKAYGIGLCSIEELGSLAPRPEEPSNGKPHRFPASNGNSSSNGAPKLRDRLCLLIRKYELDAAQVKRYAADFCGTEALREASRDLVESFISTLEQQATTNRPALVCKLNSYAPQPEVRP